MLLYFGGKGGVVRGSGAAPAGDMDWLIILLLSTEMTVRFYKNFRFVTQWILWILNFCCAKLEMLCQCYLTSQGISACYGQVDDISCENPTFSLCGRD